MFKGLEHPSAFPSMLRSTSSQSQSQMDVRGYSTLNKRDSVGSTSSTTPGGLRRRESFGSNTLNRRDSFGSTTLNRKDSYGSHTLINQNLLNQRRDSFGSTLSRGDSLDLKVTKRDSFSGGADLRRQSFGSSLYLRPDSSGATNLIRRDSFGSQNLRKDSLLHRSSVPRDYVSKSFPVDSNQCIIKSHNAINSIFEDVNGNKKETNSILRKDSWKSSNNKHVSYNEPTDEVDSVMKNKENGIAGAHRLTAANLTKHVTILEENLKNQGKIGLAKKLSFDEDNLSNHSNGKDRKISNGSNGSYLASRRISIDSLETRRNSWDRSGLNNRRGSYSSSTDFDVTKDMENEVINFSFCYYVICFAHLSSIIIN